MLSALKGGLLQNNGRAAAGVSHAARAPIDLVLLWSVLLLLSIGFVMVYSASIAMAPIGNDIQRAKLLLEGGELVGIPTETVYGLAANALDPAAVTKIFLAKNRPYFDPLIVHVASLDVARKYVTEIPDGVKELAKQDQ